MNKLKLSIIAIATIIASNTNAQTFYQCVPNGCPNGQYFDGANCKALPKQKKVCNFRTTTSGSSFILKDKQFFAGPYKVEQQDKKLLFSFIVTLNDGDTISYKDDNYNDVYVTCNDGKLQ